MYITNFNNFLNICTTTKKTFKNLKTIDNTKLRKVKGGKESIVSSGDDDT